MAKATLTLPSGTVVKIEGTAEEVRRLLELHAAAGQAATEEKTKSRGDRGLGTAGPMGDDTPVRDIVKQIRDCEEAEAIEDQILDKNSQSDRTLLPLYVTHKYFSDRFALAASEIADILKRLGAPVQQENVSKMLRTTASRYVILDSDGPPKRFKIARRGLKHIAGLFAREGADR